MKVIHAAFLRRISGVALLVLTGCGLRRDRAIVAADGEIFETVAREQLPAPRDGLGVPASPLRMDSRPAGDNTDLASTPERPKRLELGDSTDSITPGVTEVIVEQRKGILASLGITDGGPFDYPECGGARPHLAPDSTVLLPGPSCPPQVSRYVTVGLPYRGASPILDKVRPANVPAPDSTAELWTVLITESSVGPGGQQWRQYVSLFRREASTGRLVAAERFLLSWAE
jgi:hypothetical protein